MLDSATKTAVAVAASYTLQLCASMMLCMMNHVWKIARIILFPTLLNRILFVRLHFCICMGHEWMYTALCLLYSNQFLLWNFPKWTTFAQLKIIAWVAVDVASLLAVKCDSHAPLARALSRPPTTPLHLENILTRSPQPQSNPTTKRRRILQGCSADFY